jgi:FkbM family methyltransferase
MRSLAIIRYDSLSTGLTGGAEKLAARLTELEQRLQHAKDQHATARREVPSVDVLRGTFAHRLRTLRARTAAAGMATPDDVLLGASEPYRAIVGHGTDAHASSMHRTTLDGLTWWIPRRSAAAEPSGADDQRFPFRGILQTREVATGGVMLDLGANVGRMSIPRVVLGDVTRAYCAEPDPVTYACLARNVIDNGLRGLVLPDQTAIGDRDAVVPLLREGASGNFRVAASGEGKNTIDVPCCTLDKWVERLQVDLDAVTFIKVDVEGFERRLVAGASRALARRHIAWQMEIKPAGLRAVGDEPAQLYADLQRAFTEFIDLNRRAPGKRVRPISELPDALQYIEPLGKTDVLLFSV